MIYIKILDQTLAVVALLKVVDEFAIKDITLIGGYTVEVVRN
jgi:hypothetical protein